MIFAVMMIGLAIVLTIIMGVYAGVIAAAVFVAVLLLIGWLAWGENVATDPEYDPTLNAFQQPLSQKKK